MTRINMPAQLALLSVVTCLVNVLASPPQYSCRNFILATIPNHNRTVPADRSRAKNVPEKPRCVNGVCEYDPKAKDATNVRGGGGMSDSVEDDFDQEDYYDEYDDDYDEAPPPPRERRRPPPGPSQRRRPPPVNRRDRRYRSSRRGGPLNTASSLAKKTVGVTANAAATSLKTSGKAAFYLVSPKHVRRNEVWGVWRLDQQVGKNPDGPFVSCAANVELTPRGDCITKYDEEVFCTPYLFKEKSWPQSCSVEFEARAFQGPNDKGPVLMLYKGYFRRKIADLNVIKIVGKIYALRKNRFGRGSKRVLVGTFVARRRITARPQGGRLQRREGDRYDEDEYDDDGYDDEGEYEDDDGYDEEDEENY